MADLNQIHRAFAAPSDANTASFGGSDKSAEAPTGAGGTTPTGVARGAAGTSGQAVAKAFHVTPAVALADRVAGETTPPPTDTGSTGHSFDMVDHTEVLVTATAASPPRRTSRSPQPSSAVPNLPCVTSWRSAMVPEEDSNGLGHPPVLLKEASPRGDGEIGTPVSTIKGEGNVSDLPGTSPRDRQVVTSQSDRQVAERRSPSWKFAPRPSTRRASTPPSSAMSRAEAAKGNVSGGEVLHHWLRERRRQLSGRIADSTRSGSSHGAKSVHSSACGR